MDQPKGRGTGRKPPPAPGPGVPSTLPSSGPQVKKLLKALERGHFLEVACALAGLPRSTVYKWLKVGGKPKSKPIYRAFVDAVNEAEAKGEDRPVAVLEKAMNKGDTKAAAFLLERRHHRRWGRRTFRVEEEQGHVSAVGAVVPYQVRMPEVDPLEPPTEPKIEKSDD